MEINRLFVFLVYINAKLVSIKIKIVLLVILLQLIENKFLLVFIIVSCEMRSFRELGLYFSTQGRFSDWRRTFLLNSISSSIRFGSLLWLSKNRRCWLITECLCVEIFPSLFFNSIRKKLGFFLFQLNFSRKI